jgi:hypothetical protein
MRLAIASCLALFWTVQPPPALAQAAAGLRSGILPDGAGATESAEATAVLFQLSPTSSLTFSTSAVALQDGWIDRSDDGATAFTARLRASYQATPTLKSFVEAVVTHHQTDGAVDPDGSRSSAAYGWRAGVAFDGAHSAR